MERETRKAVGYVRVSTIEQEQGNGIEWRTEQVHKCAEEHGLELVQVFQETISGGREAEERAALEAALDVIADGDGENADISILVIPELDRLARKLHVQEAALAHVWRHGGTVYAHDIGEVPQDDPDDPMRTAMRQMMGVFAQLERGMIRARMRAGKRIKAANGGYVGGRPGFGYKAVDGELVEAPDEQEVIKLVHKLRDDGRTLREIARTLEDRGVTTKLGKQSWHANQVRRLLRRTS